MSGLSPRLAIVEPWFAESHAVLFGGVAEHSGLECAVVSLPGGRWRWRMRLGAWHLAQRLSRLEPEPDVLLVSDYVNLPVLRGLCPAARVPAAVYFLENQATYPLREGRQRDFEFVAINLLTCLSAERCVWCSRQQLEAFLAELPRFLARDPDADADAALASIERKSSVVPIGVDLDRFDRARLRRDERFGRPLHVVWPHRFEHDKNPADFFEVLIELADEGLDFELSAIGKSYRDVPPEMLAAREKLGDRVRAWGFLEGDTYPAALAAADVVVSTAWQETQGLAVIEAIRAGCDPLLPDRLSYPEVLGASLAAKHLYSSRGDLRRRLRWMMRHPDRVRASPDHWREMERFGWPTVGPRFRELTEELAVDR